MKARTISQNQFGSALALGALLLACVRTAGAQRPQMPSCPALEKASAEALVGFLGQDRKGLSGACLEFAIRTLPFIADQLPEPEASRAVDELIPFLDFQSTMLGDPRFFNSNTLFYEFPARTAITGIANVHVDDAKLVQGVVTRLIAVVADTTVSDTVADNAVWALTGIVGYRNPTGGHLKAVETLVEAARQNPNAFSATRLREQARKLAQQCIGSELRSQCDAAAN